ncbi:hypothetical protein LMH87_007432 [Akanthomyces muscarius]|uniref:Glycosyl transferase family 1 domain-containing protein n=1 Tax=Akanthomyces muscarius TaxID=2231603 RepID=A0A9W8URC1_AKAMU|nr:hypothetical protein LMH87_007432 [Akanthomyces muscarius]KAJ4165817.1 hypothetical protein LMH87_007432 [Akanthomyces muscarius]
MMDQSLAPAKERPRALGLTVIYIGISAKINEHHDAEIAIGIRDNMYLLDCHNEYIRPDHENIGDAITDHVIEFLQLHERSNRVKLIGAGIPSNLVKITPSLCSRLWLELDTVPIVLPVHTESHKRLWAAKHIDEQADSMARRCIANFGPSMTPILRVGWHSAVQASATGRICLNTLQDYEGTCSQRSWETLSFYAEKLRGRKTKVAFFSATPQGGGVALMRHALLRFSELLGLDIAWYVPKPRPSVFRITKNIHNILQGVAEPDQHVTAEDKAAVIEWITDNAQRYWLNEGGPLRSPEDGGANIIIIDDPQMIGLIPIIKDATVPRPVLFRSHIQIRSDLVSKPGTPQADVWNFIWSHVKKADIFISHPIPCFVPETVPPEKVAYLPASSDWLDGLNKDIDQWDTGYYMHNYNTQCHGQRMTELDWPDRKYIIQIARFDPAKGIPSVIDAYAEFRRRYTNAGLLDPPQLVICGNGSVDDPDGGIVYDQTMARIETKYPHLQNDISVMRLDHNDQLLNVLLSNAHVVLQLSIREGFEVKVSEALHAGCPVIATTAGGIPLQVTDGITGYLVQPGDWNAVAGHLMDLFASEELHEIMSHAARTSVSDEVGTVGNALAWYFLVSKFAENGKFHPNGRWVNDMAREEAGKAYLETESCLNRQFTAARLN